MIEENSWMESTLLAKSKKNLLDFLRKEEEFSNSTEKLYDFLERYLNEELEKVSFRLNYFLPILQDIIGYKGVKRLFLRLVATHRKKGLDISIQPLGYEELNEKNLTKLNSFTLTYCFNSDVVVYISYINKKESKIETSFFISNRKFSQNSLNIFLEEFNSIIKSLYDLERKLNVSFKVQQRKICDYYEPKKETRV